MKDGFVSFAACSPNIRVADCRYNMSEIQKAMEEARQAGAQICVFPELSLCGATCGDLFFQKTLLEGCEAALKELMESTAEMDLAACVGLPVFVYGRVYNCAAVFAHGQLKGLVPKTQLRNDREGNEQRHFSKAPAKGEICVFAGQETYFGTDALFTLEGAPDFAMALEFGTELSAPQPPSVRHALSGATVIVCPAAESEYAGRGEARKTMALSQSARLKCGYVYCGAGEGESTTDMVFSGQHILAENGLLLAEGKPFEGKTTLGEIDVSALVQARRESCGFDGETEEYRRISLGLRQKETNLTRKYPRFPFFEGMESEKEQKAACELILDIQARGLAKRLEHAHAKTAVVGVSGGLDSCLALLVAHRAMKILGRPSGDVLAVTMPCFGTTKRTKSNAEVLSEQLGATFVCIPVTQTVTAHFEEIGHDPSVQNVVFENAQARARTYVLMDLANEKNGMVVGTGDLSELALGWATYNGDHMSMYGVNASIPKTMVRALVRHCAETAEETLSKTLLDIIDTPVSPELLPAKEEEITQVTEDIVGPYELHDFILYYAVGKGFSPKKIWRLMKKTFEGDYAPETLRKWLLNFYRRFFIQQFKRSCLPDGVKATPVSLSPRGAWQMPSDAVSEMWKREIEDIEA